MLESLYIKSIEKKDEIDEIIENFHKDINREEVKKQFNNYTFTPEKQSKTFISTDGSFNSTKYMPCFVYAIGSNTLISKSGQLIKEYEGSDILTLPTTQSTKINRTMSRQMDILENKSTLKTIQKHPDEIDYVYIDGSIQGKLQNFRITHELDPQIENYLKSSIISFENQLLNQDFEVELNYPNVKRTLELDIRQILEENEIDKTFEEIRYDVIEYYEQLELLACIRHIIKYYHQKIICISKTSTTRRFFKEQIPDATVVEYTTKESGYITPQIIEGNRIYITTDDNTIQTIDYPLYNNEIPFYNYVTLFVRFKYRANVLKIEIPVLKEIEADNTIANIESILEDISTTCTDGYPHILKKVHDEVVIKNKDMERVINKFPKLKELGEKTGRDMLKRRKRRRR